MQTDKIEKAYEIAEKAHRGQKDKAGRDYIFHPLAVAEFVAAEDEKIVALLHDVIEDGGVKAEQIRKEFGLEIAHAVELLTKKEGYILADYLKAIRRNKLARAVKFADMTHNSDLSRFENPTPKDIERAKKYKEGIEFLKDFRCEVCGKKEPEDDYVCACHYSGKPGNRVISQEDLLQCKECYQKSLRIYDELESAFHDFLDEREEQN